jgi:tripartite-type tricarboxylate transporter receptor subunit TctC
LRALAVTTPNRSAALPNVPTLAEAGLPDQEADTILSILVPAHTPQEILTLLHREIAGAMKQPDAAEKLVALGFNAVASSPDEFAARIDKDTFPNGQRSSEPHRPRGLGYIGGMKIKLHWRPAFT